MIGAKQQARLEPVPLGRDVRKQCDLVLLYRVLGVLVCTLRITCYNKHKEDLQYLAEVT